MAFNGYLYSQQLIEEFDSLVTLYPDYIERLTLPFDSSGGPDVSEPSKPMFYYKIGQAAPGAPKVLINAGIHAREMAPPDSVLTFFIELFRARELNSSFITSGFTMKNVDSDDDNDPLFTGKVTYQPWQISADEVKRFVDELEIYVVPSSNPDGRDFAMTPGNSKWRTNRNPLSATCAANLPPAIGVDLNRNFDVAFKMDEYFDLLGEALGGEHTVPYDEPCNDTLTHKFNSNLPESYTNYPGFNQSRAIDDGTGIFSYYEDRDVYQGPSGGSENETKNLKHLLDQLNITYFLDLHQAYRAFLIPWGMNSTQVYDNPDAAQTYLNSSLDRVGSTGGREYNGDDNINQYREYFPDKDNFELQVKHYFLSAQMSDTIFKAADGDVHARNRSKYKLLPTASGLYPAMGSSMDYALSCCMQADGSGHAEVIPGKFPKFSLTMEAGHRSDGLFWPLKKKKQYNKVEREVHCALRGVFAYAVNSERYGVTKTPK